MASRSRRRSGTSLRSLLVYVLLMSFLSGVWFLIVFHQKYYRYVTQDVSSMNGWLPEYDSEYEIESGTDLELDDERSNHPLVRGRNTDPSATLVLSTTTTTTISSISPESSQVQVVNQTNTTNAKNRLYCMVPFIWSPRFLHSYHAIHRTWGKRCDVLRFFVDPIIGDSQVGYYNMSLAPDAVAAARNANLTLPHDVVVLHDMRRPWHTCNDEENEDKTCRNIWEKIWRAWVYVVTGKGGSTPNGSDDIIGANSCEWFVKVDSDTFLFPENLRRYVKARNWSYNDHHYFGHVLHHRVSDRGVPIVAGAAVFFSKATLLAAADSFQKMPMENGHEEEDGTCRDAFTGTEEVVTAVCLNENSNIIAEPAIDARGREEISLFDVDDIIAYNRTDQGEWWFWEGKTRYPCHDAGDCLAYLPLAFHGYKDSEVWLDLEKEFYGSIMKGEKDDSLAKRNDNKIAAHNWENFDRTFEYFEKVRAAMRVAAREEESSANTFEQFPTRKKNRLYCMVPIIFAPKYMQAFDAIRNTWGKRCDLLKFFVDPIIESEDRRYIDLRSSQNGANMSLPEDVVIVYHIHRPWHSCDTKKDETCRNIWEKVWRSWLWIDDNGESESSDWFVKVDADSYLFPENLKKYVEEKNWSPDDHHYFGHKLRHTEDRNLPPIVAGSSVFFSRATVKGLAVIFRKFKFADGNKSTRHCMDSFTPAEETLTAVCLKQHLGINATHVLDDSGDELISVSPIEDTLLWNRTEQGEWWYWKNKPRTDPKTGREIHNCCGEFPIAFHGYKDPLWFYKLEDELYEMHDLPGVNQKWKTYKWHNFNETNEYFDRIRRARKDNAVV